VGLTLENTAIPTILRYLVLSLDDFELPEEAAAHHELWDMEPEQGVSSYVCS